MTRQTVFGGLLTVHLAHGDLVQAIVTRTNSCINCGMTAGELSVKVCGNLGCCFSPELDNDNINFLPGSTDSFRGPTILGECDEYQIGDRNGGPIRVTLIHSGTDGLQLDSVDIETDERVVTCLVNGQELDGDDWSQFYCD
ncbi:hypothetical protein TCAL_05210 [Tigriopus californicus]|uniref:Uncharacterized protein n=1 Tax=Tigriopus californicus TaxID=6832 RepID=A0A553NWY9_TIGCA|nr:hypothetical protein TCAL_05210 [Tigriopus californicus]